MLSTRLIVIAVLVIALALGVVAWLFEGMEPEPVAVVPAPVAPEVPQREVILYFGVSDGHVLAPESRPLQGCDPDLDCMVKVVHALIAGPGQGKIPVLPKGTQLRGIEVVDDLVKVDFGASFLQRPTSGSLGELLAVYSVVDSLVVNFPYVRRVELLVEGKGVSTLHGHVDIRQPLTADFSLTRVSPTASPANEILPSFEEQEVERETPGANRSQR